MTFSFTVSKRDHWRATREVYNRTVVNKVAWAFFVGIPILIVVLMAADGQDVSTFLQENWLATFAGPFLMLVGFPLIQYWSVWMYHRNHPTLRGTQVFELTPSHLKMKGPLHNTELSWDAVRQIVETRAFVLFYISKATAYFLPKSAIPPRELAELRSQLTQWLPGRVHVLKEPPLHAAA